MANHEVNITCRNCATEFDARLHGTQCPRCSAQYMFNPNKPTIMSKELFHINDSCLMAYGFSLEQIWDKNSPADKHDTVHVKTYFKHIDDDIKIEVVFGYSVDPNGILELNDSNCYLVVGDICKPLKYTSIYQLKDLFVSIQQSLKEVA